MPVWYLCIVSIQLAVVIITWGFPGSSAGKESACDAGDPGSIPGLGRSPEEGKGYPHNRPREFCFSPWVAKSRT